MQDRVSQYPGRVKLTPVSGQENVYDMEWADGATVEGTPLNKANLLSDSTASALGLNQTSGTVDQALNKLSDAALIGEQKLLIEKATIYSGYSVRDNAVSGSNEYMDYNVRGTSQFFYKDGKFYATAFYENESGTPVSRYMLVSEDGINWTRFFDVFFGGVEVSDIKSNVALIGDYFYRVAESSTTSRPIQIRRTNINTGETESFDITGGPILRSGTFDIAVGGHDSYIVVVVGRLGNGDGIYRSSNGGETWSKVSGTYQFNSIPSIASTDGAVGFVAKKNGSSTFSLFRASGSLSSWTESQISSPFNNASPCFVAYSGYSGYVYMFQKTTDEIRRYYNNFASNTSVSIPKDGQFMGVFSSAQYDELTGKYYILKRGDNTDDLITLYSGSSTSFTKVKDFYFDNDVLGFSMNYIVHNGKIIFTMDGGIHMIFYTYDLTNVGGDSINVTSLPATARIQSAEQTITDLDLELIQMGQQMTDLELMILEGYDV